MDQCAADLLAKLLGKIGTLERAGGPAAGASPTVLGALPVMRWYFAQTDFLPSGTRKVHPEQISPVGPVPGMPA